MAQKGSGIAEEDRRESTMSHQLAMVNHSPRLTAPRHAAAQATQNDRAKDIVCRSDPILSKSAFFRQARVFYEKAQAASLSNKRSYSGVSARAPTFHCVVDASRCGYRQCLCYIRFVSCSPAFCAAIASQRPAYAARASPDAWRYFAAIPTLATLGLLWWGATAARLARSVLRFPAGDEC